MNTFWFWWLQHTPKRWEKGMFKTLTSALLLITMFHCLELRILIVKVLQAKFFFQSCLIQDFRGSAVCDRHCLILFFVTGHTFSIGDRSGLQASLTHSPCLYTKPHCCSTCRMRAGWHCLDHGLPMKDIILTAVYTVSLYNPNISLHVNSTFAHKSPMLFALLHPQRHLT